jgi:hypothetical protein
MASPDDRPSPLTTSQQELSHYVAGDGDPRLDPLYIVARACLPHTLAAAKEITEGPHPNQLPELVTFLKDYGVFDDASPDTEYFHQGEHGRGWHLPRLADRLRANDNTVVVQNLIYGPDADIAPAVAAGRARTPAEKEILTARMMYGGRDKSEWLKAVDETLTSGGQAMPIIQIPRMDGKGPSGHSVLITSHKNGIVEYFDSDSNAIARYEKNELPIPDIARVEGEKRLFYRQPDAQFNQRMTGEVVHIFNRP